MKIATWNIERLQKRKNDKILQSIREIKADILILTEASNLIDLSDDYLYSAKTAALYNINNNYRVDEYRIIIFSKFPIIKIIKTYDDSTSCCVEIKTTNENLLVYGTIIGIYGNRRKCFNEDLEKQIEDINKISQSGNFCLAGDLNISFSDNYYFTKLGREKLNTAFTENKLINYTKDIPQNIDHIIISSNFTDRIENKITTWNQNKLLSDHIGVCVEFL